MNQLYVSPEIQRELIGLRDKLMAIPFMGGDWRELGMQTGLLEIIERHPRLLRSLSFEDQDYSDNCLQVLLQMVRADANSLAIIRETIAFKAGEDGDNISTAQSTNRKIVFTPSVFNLPAGGVEQDLVAVMMPFAPNFEPVFSSIAAACGAVGLRCLRAKDIWEHEAVIQDIFGLIFRSAIVVCDFSGRNPNVFYEAGIAHTLGKHVVPITQADEDIPFDLKHHRYLRYLNNNEGRHEMHIELAKRLKFLAGDISSEVRYAI